MTDYDQLERRAAEVEGILVHLHRDELLRLVAIAKAAERLCFLMERDNCVLPGPEFAALRAALSPEKDRT